jgi:hypothetical protein
MAHARTQIREVFKTWLVDLPEFGGRIDIDRTINSQFDELPHVIVYNKPERSGIIDIAGSVLSREFDLAILIKALAEGDAVMDDYAALVESVVSQKRELGTLWHEVTLISSIPDFDDSGESTVGTLELVYRVKYMTLSSDPSQTR